MATSATRKTKPKAKRAQPAAPVRPPRDLFNDPGQPKMLLTTDEAAARLGVSRATLQRLMYRGDCPSIKIGALRRIPVPQLEAYLAGLIEGAAFTLTA